MPLGATAGPPGAWAGEELAADRAGWTHTLSEDESAALLDAVQRCGVTSGAELAQCEPPPGFLGARLEELCCRVRAALYRGPGVFLLRGVPVEQWGSFSSATAFWLLGTRLGRAVPQNKQGHVLGHVRDAGGDASDPKTRLYTTSAAQPWHTDSADVVGLLCLEQSLKGGVSLVASSTAVYRHVLARSPELAETLTQPFVWDRKGEVPPGCSDTFDMPVISSAAGRLLSLYDRSFIDAAVKRWPGVVPPLTPRQTAALDAADAAATALRLEMVLARGDVQFLHNHNVWHARSAFSDAPGERSRRHLLRLWLAAPPAEAWELPPCFAQRYGSVAADAAPPRGGIRCEGVPLCAPLSVADIA